MHQCRSAPKKCTEWASGASLSGVSSPQRCRRGAMASHLDGWVECYEVNPDMNDRYGVAVAMRRDGVLRMEPLKVFHHDWGNSGPSLSAWGDGEVVLHYEFIGQSVQEALRPANEVRNLLIAMELWPADLQAPPPGELLKPSHEGEASRKANAQLRKWWEGRTS